jgi:hypothetical protein
LSESVAKNVVGAQILQTFQLGYSASADIPSLDAQISANSRNVCTNGADPLKCLQNRVAGAHDGENGREPPKKVANPMG